MAHAIELRLPYRAPCDVAGLIQFVAARAVPGVEEVDGDVYLRSVRLQSGPGVVALRPGDREHVEARLWVKDAGDLDAAVAASRRLLDLDTEPRPIVDALGRRVPGVTDPDELAIRAVLGQQVSLAGAATLAGRLVSAYGEPLEQSVGSVTHLFPSAAALARADPDHLAMPARS